MNDTKQLELYFTQCEENVHLLQKAYEQINRAMNDDLNKQDLASAQIQTRVLALVFSAWVEANLLKINNTPDGLTLAEISRIKEIYQVSTQHQYLAPLVKALLLAESLPNQESPTTFNDLEGIWAGASFSFADIKAAEYHFSNECE
jgi:hypothetical protein